MTPGLEAAARVAAQGRRWMRSSDLPSRPRGPDRKVMRVCVWCHGTIEGRRTRWCGEACVNAYLVRSRADSARSAVEKRDGGVCCRCGIDTSAARRLLERLSPPYPASMVVRGGRCVHMTSADRAERVTLAEELSRRMAAARGVDPPRDPAEWGSWEADHIVAVVDGGGACGPENLQTLCVPCHRADTAALAARRARERRQHERAQEPSLFGQPKEQP